MNTLENQSPKILVIGDLIVDHYIWGSCDRISPEAPVQIVSSTKEKTLLGGAGNVVNNLKSLNAQVDIISIIGICDASKEIIALFKKINVDTNYLFIQKNRITSKKTRVIAGQQQIVRIDKEVTAEIDSVSENSILEATKANINEYDLILLSDYGKGILTTNLTKSLIYIANINNKKILIDPKGLNYKKYSGAYLLTPNLKEASEATKIDINDKDFLLKAICELKNLYDLEVSLITLSELGIAIYDDNLRILPTYSKEIFDVTGAGDTVLASLGYALSCGLNIDEAVNFSNLTAGVVVSKLGSSTATFEEINKHKINIGGSESNIHLKIMSEIEASVDSIRKKDKKIVFTNGCFDLIHIGHIKYLEAAKKFGDILIIGLNSDRSIRLLKGKDRPIVTELDRAYLLAAIEVVDYVVIFDEETPYELINKIKPEVLVKGGDYKHKEVIGSDLVNEVKIVPYIDNRSTSKIIQKIKN